MISDKDIAKNIQRRLSEDSTLKIFKTGLLPEVVDGKLRSFVLFGKSNTIIVSKEIFNLIDKNLCQV